MLIIVIILFFLSLLDAAANTGSLTITFIEARGLKAADRGGTSDPFVKLRIGKKDVYKTNHIKKTLTPIWYVYNISSSDRILSYIIKSNHHDTRSALFSSSFTFPYF